MEAKNLFVGLIPDGGRRSVDHDITRYPEAYERGADIVGEMLKLCVEDRRVKIFAAWGLSDDNVRKRSSVELHILNELFVRYLTKLRRDLETEPYQDVKVVHLGNPSFLSQQVQALIAEMMLFTALRTGKIFALGLGHGAEDELERAAALLAKRKAVGEESVRLVDCLDLPVRGNIPFQPVDLIVRTGTDPLQPYTSAYLLPYQVGGGTQEHFIPAYLPDCPPSAISEAIDDYEKRLQRRGG